MTQRLELEGRKFGRLTVVAEAGVRKQQTFWKCTCECGGFIEAPGVELLRGRIMSCGCVKKNDLTGQRFGRLLVKHIVGRKHGYLTWLCICDCGKKKIIKSGNLKCGRTNSCGCLYRDVCIERGKRVAKQNLLIAGIARRGSALRKIMGSYKSQARKRGLAWSLTGEQFEKLISSPCFYTGLPPASVYRAPSGEPLTYNGIDRTNNGKGYTLENSVPCLAAINRMKMDMSHEEFIELCRLVAERFPRTV